MDKQAKSQKQGGDYQPTSRKLVERAFKRWNRDQNFKYVQFLIQQEESFQSERTRRISKVFKRLSAHIGTKTQNQCKSHHQKMIAQHQSIEEIHKYFQEKYGKCTQDITNMTQNKQTIFETLIIEEKKLIEFQQPAIQEESMFNFQYGYDSILFDNSC